jgi:AcrR family transcriptional regulator
MPAFIHVNPLSSRAEQRREQILEKAIALFAETGYNELDLQVLADTLGIGKGTLYRHFGNKEGLFLAAVDRVMVLLNEHVLGAVGDIDDPLERIRRAVHAYLAFFHDHPEAVEMLIQERAHFKDRKRPTYFEHRELHVERWRDLYRRLIAEGRFRDLPAEQISDVLGDLLYGTMFVNYIAGRALPPDVMAERILDVVLHGLLTDRERRERARRRPTR